MYIRLADEADIDILFSWANDSDTRKNAFHTEQIPYEEHKKWFERLLLDKNQVQYILMVDEIPAGQIRFNVSEDKAVIDYSVAPDMRGRGFGKKLISMACEEMQKKHPEICTFIGQVKTGNSASERCFIDCGYTETYKQFEWKCKE